MKNKLLILLAFSSFLWGCGPKPAQKEGKGITDHDLPFQTLSLKDTTDFNYSSSRNKNWAIAGDVTSDWKAVHSLNILPGTGILVSKPTDSDKAELLTKFKHGDIDLELDFMMPKGSNSGIYFMGRYEVQLFDSWLVPDDSLGYIDCGGIYERMANGRGYEGHAPAINACKAPGLWQHLKVRFQAPRFDSAGHKLSNARFVWVYLNGALVQQNVEASLPTLGSFYSDEQPLGPLEIQGSHGPIAFKNIRYKTYIPERIELKNMELKVYKSLYPNVDTLNSLKPDRVLHPDSLSQLSYNKFEQGVYRGTMMIPDEEEYIFKLQAGGPSWLWIDSGLVVDNNTSGDYFHPWYGRVHLKKGDHSFKLIYNNRYQQFKLSYQATHIPMTALTTQSSEFPELKPKPDIIEVKNGRTKVQRGFLMHRGEKKTHAIAVGLPGKMNYAYSLSDYNLLNVWRGGFVDAADMWRERGEQQLEQPLGGLIEFSGKPSIQALKNKKDLWPDSVAVDSNVFTKRGYQLTKNGSPVFFYTYKNIDIRDFSHPDSLGRGLKREVSFNFHGTTENKLYFLIADGKLIRKLKEGGYSIDDNYYIDQVKSNNAPIVIKKGAYSELLVPLSTEKNSSGIQYDVIW